MIPAFQNNGNLPPGIHSSLWDELDKRYGISPYRLMLLKGLKTACVHLKFAGCQRLFLDGSFVTTKTIPGDYDALWDTTGVDIDKLVRAEPLFFDFSNKRQKQKQKYLGEFFPAQQKEGITGKTFLEFFQTDKDSGDPKGIIELLL